MACACVLFQSFLRCVVHELGTFACAHWWARESVSASGGNTSFKQACNKGIRERCNTKVYVQVRVVRMRRRAWLRPLCFHLSCKRLRKPQALNMRTRSRSNTFRLRAFPTIIPSCLSDIPCLQRIALKGFLAI